MWTPRRKRMSKPEFKKTLLSPEPTPGPVDLPKLTDAAINNGATDQQARIPQNERVKEHRSKHREAPVSFAETLDDAERLLKYAAEVGLDVDPDVRNKVLAARTVDPEQWTQTTVSDLLDALTKLAARVKPVSAESLKPSNRDPRRTIRAYWTVAICLAIVIIPFSVATFVTSAISDALRKDIGVANELAVRINTDRKSTRLNSS